MHQQNKRIRVYPRLLAASKKYWVAFMIGIIATIVMSLSDASFAWLIKPIVDKGFIDKNNLFIRWLPIVIIILFVIRSVAGFSSNYFVVRVARNVVMDFRRKLFRHLMKLPARFFDTNPSGKLLSTILYNVEQVAQASSDVLVTIMREASLAVGLVIVMFMVNWRLTLIFIVVTPLIAWGIKICSSRLRKLSSNVQTSVAEVSHIANEGIEAYQVIRLFDGQAYEAGKFDQATKVNRQRELKVEVTNSIGTAAIQLLVSVPLAVILYAATSPSLAVSAGSFAAIISSMVMLVRPMRRITNLNNFIQKGIAGAESIFAMLDEEIEKDLGEYEKDRVKGNIQFKSVNFEYHNSNRKTLTGINFQLEAGKTVALVGHSGSGKSTLVSLLPRFYDVSNGEILVDDVNIKDYRLKSLRSQFALVSQHTILFNDTVANNIAYAQGDHIDQARLEKAAKMANAFDFIQALPQGFNTQIGEDGLMLSGGQRQRLAIARALYKDAPILILDEATSSLDTQSEREIQLALSELMKERTTIVIAHRLSTIENADEILVMDQGMIKESGTHNTLLANNGAYAKLYRTQFSDATPVTCE